MLRALLTTWENWSARNTLIRALDTVTTEESREKITAALDGMPAGDPLAALRDSAELVELLTAWQWQAVHDARRGGASWEDIADATGVEVERARADYAAVIERQVQVLGREVGNYRDVIA